MYGFYKGVKSDNSTIYDDLTERMTVTHFKYLLFILLMQFLTEVFLFFPFYFGGEMDYEPYQYFIFYVAVPLAFNLSVVTLNYRILKGASNTFTGAYSVSFAMLLLLSCIYMIHNVFQPVTILLCAPMIISCVYGDKVLTGLLCLGSIVSKLGLDYLRTLSFIPSYYANATKLRDYGTLNYFVYYVINIGLLLLCFSIINVEKEKRTLITELEEQRNNADSKIQSDRAFRSRLNENKIMNYVANITSNTIIEGGEHFGKMYEDGEIPAYMKCMEYYVKNVIHPEDIEVFAGFGQAGYFEYLQLHSPKYNLRVRISPQKALSCLNLDEKATLRLLSKNEEWFYISFNAQIVTDPSDSSILLYAEILDVDEEVKKEQELVNELSLDALTGIMNRKTGEKKVTEYISRNISGSLFMMDLDGFKSINDNLGHPEGDKLLQETAAIIKEAFRNDDVTCRLGGDEFMIYAPGLETARSVEKANALIASLTRKINSPQGLELSVGASIGLAFFPADGHDYDELYANADAALYESKRTGKGKVVLYNTLPNARASTQPEDKKS